MIDYLERCEICKDVFKNGHYRNRHLKNQHDLTFEQYIIKFVYNGVQPTGGKQYIYEIDGEFFHSDKLTNLNIYQLNSVVNDYVKTQHIDNSEYKLYRIFVNNIPDNINENSLIENSYIIDFSLEVNDIIMSNDYLYKYLLRNKEKSLSKFITSCIKFVKIFEPNIYKKYLKQELINSISLILETNRNINGLNFTIENIIKYINK